MAHLRISVKPTPAAERTVELPEDWDTMDEEERTDFCQDEAQDYVVKHANYSYEVVE